MSLQLGVELPSVKTISELQTFFEEEQMADFLKNTLTRSERTAAFMQGVELGIDAAEYLFGQRKHYKDRTMFVVGHLADEPTRAYHTLNYAGFTWHLKNSEGIVFDQISKSFRPTILSPDVVQLDIECQDTPTHALYELPEHHDLAGNPGVISFVVPEIKAAYESIARTRSAEVETAKSLIAQA